MDPAALLRRSLRRALLRGLVAGLLLATWVAPLVLVAPAAWLIALGVCLLFGLGLVTPALLTESWAQSRDLSPGRTAVAVGLVAAVAAPALGFQGTYTSRLWTTGDIQAALGGVAQGLSGLAHARAGALLLLLVPPLSFAAAAYVRRHPRGTHIALGLVVVAWTFLGMFPVLFVTQGVLVDTTRPAGDLVIGAYTTGFLGLALGWLLYLLLAAADRVERWLRPTWSQPSPDDRLPGTADERIHPGLEP